MRAVLPKYTPMHPTQVREPFHRAGWIYEEKVDSGGDQNLSLLPLRDRRPHLEEIVAGHDVVLPARRLAVNGLEAWAQVLERG